MPADKSAMSTLGQAGRTLGSNCMGGHHPQWVTVVLQEQTLLQSPRAVHQGQGYFRTIACGHHGTKRPSLLFTTAETAGLPLVIYVTEPP